MPSTESAEASRGLMAQEGPDLSSVPYPIPQGPGLLIFNSLWSIADPQSKQG